MKHISRIDDNIPTKSPPGDPAHKQTAAVLRAAFQTPRTTPSSQDLVRDLADYDRAFGLEVI